MTKRVDHSPSHHAQIAQLSEHTSQLHHTQQTQKSQKLQRIKMQRTKAQRNMLAAKFLFNKKWAHNHAMAGRGAMSQKVATMFGARPDRSAKANGKQTHLRGKDKETDVRTPEHEKEHDKDRVERERPHDQQQPREREKEREKEKEKERDRQQQQQQSGRDPRKDGDSPQQQQQQHGEQRRQPQNDDGQPQQQQQQQKRQSRDGGENGGGAKFAISSRKVGVAVKVPENFQALGTKLKDATPDEMGRVLLQTFAKVTLRLVSQIENGCALAPLLMLSATSPAALRRSASRMQAHISSATFNQNSRASQPNAPQNAQAKASATVGILNHSADLTRTRQQFDVDYDVDQQSILSVRDFLMAAKAAMPTLVTSHGAQTGSENPPEVRVAPTAPGTGS
ncbi:hypothetical protein [Paraburkholderia sp.]|uniref:hypothetical protein n=1 Tax=Paraburkholderia sp. TaxID=1926495 RepID=UPI003D6E6972